MVDYPFFSWMDNMSIRLNKINKTALLSALLLEISTGAVQAATIFVDNNTCTLSDAITAANQDTISGGCVSGSGTDVIEIPLNSTIDLNNELPEISDSLTVNCNNSTIQRNSNAANFPIFTNGVVNDLTLNDCIITNGVSPNLNKNLGGGVTGASYGFLTINRSTITGNIGGGVYTYGQQVEINDSMISNNLGHANATSMSAGISIFGGSVNINNSTISGNKTYGDAQGGGIYFYEGYFMGSGSLDLTNTTISNNSTESGGGGIHINSNTKATIDGEVTVRLKSVTLVNNTTQGAGGGIFNDSGDFNVIRNSIISGNPALQANEIFSTNADGFELTDFNLIGLNGDEGIEGFVFDQNSTNAIIQTANLSEVIDTQLTDNGGLTPTHALSPNSVAIDFIPLASCFESTDQTGKARPIDGNADEVADCDVGAFEQFGPDVIFENGFE